MIDKHPVLIEWRDAGLCSADWKAFDSDHYQLMVIQSVGWIIKEADEYIVISPHETKVGGLQVCGEMMIPRSAVIRMSPLKVIPCPLS